MACARRQGRQAEPGRQQRKLRPEHRRSGGCLREVHRQQEAEQDDAEQSGMPRPEGCSASSPSAATVTPCGQGSIRKLDQAPLAESATGLT